MTRRGTLALAGSLLAHGGLLAVLLRIPTTPQAPRREAVPVDVWERTGSGGRGGAAPRTAPEAPSLPATQRARTLGAPEEVVHATPPARRRALAAPQAPDDVEAPELKAPDVPEPSRTTPGGISDALRAAGSSGFPAGVAGQGAARGRGSSEAAGSASAVGSGESAEPSAAWLETLHRRLAASARACYPAAARRFRLRGSTPVRFCLDGKGGAGEVALAGSTGSPLLDRAATDCVVPGALPLRGTGCYTVTVEFTEP